MIRLAKDKHSSGYWIEVKDHGVSDQMAVTAEEVLDLNNQIIELLINKRRCPKCLGVMSKRDKHCWECKKCGVEVSIG